MRIEGIPEVSAPQLTGNAFEQHAPVRTATTQRTARPAQNVNPTTEAPADAVVDVHDSAAASSSGQEVEFKVPHRVIPAGQQQSGVIDRDGDGMITLSDLPFDYFQISRQANRKFITPPSTDIPF
ncbi:MAG: hypothetical protein U0Q03_00545 [Acidimicrobiales bacterium]